MKCARCNRSLDRPAAVINGNPLGPKCWAKMGGKNESRKTFKAVRNEKADLFDGVSMYEVQVIDGATGIVVKHMPVSSKLKAERVEAGLNINLNHDQFYTQIVKIDENKTGEA
jgi:uncharacterized FlaG/YvyC family protein